jgi:hypothetical protein
MSLLCGLASFCHGPHKLVVIALIHNTHSDIHDPGNPAELRNCGTVLVHQSGFVGAFRQPVICHQVSLTYFIESKLDANRGLRCPENITPAPRARPSLVSCADSSSYLLPNEGRHSTDHGSGTQCTDGEGAAVDAREPDRRRLPRRPDQYVLLAGVVASAPLDWCFLRGANWAGWFRASKRPEPAN